MKYRRGDQGKIKYEHCMIKDLREFLESLEKKEQIKSMITGEIKPVKKNVFPPVIRRITPTVSGFKIIFHSGSAVQEVFFVAETGQEERVRTLLECFSKKQNNTKKQYQDKLKNLSCSN